MDIFIDTTGSDEDDLPPDFQNGVPTQPTQPAEGSTPCRTLNLENGQDATRSSEDAGKEAHQCEFLAFSDDDDENVVQCKIFDLENGQDATVPVEVAMYSPNGASRNGNMGRTDEMKCLDYRSARRLLQKHAGSSKLFFASQNGSDDAWRRHRSQQMEKMAHELERQRYISRLMLQNFQDFQEASHLNGCDDDDGSGLSLLRLAADPSELNGQERSTWKENSADEDSAPSKDFNERVRGPSKERIGVQFQEDGADESATRKEQSPQDDVCSLCHRRETCKLCCNECIQGSKSASSDIVKPVTVSRSTQTDIVMNRIISIHDLEEQSEEEDSDDEDCLPLEDSNEGASDQLHGPKGSTSSPSRTSGHVRKSAMAGHGLKSGLKSQKSARFSTHSTSSSRPKGRRSEAANPGKAKISNTFGAELSKSVADDYNAPREDEEFESQRRKKSSKDKRQSEYKETYASQDAPAKKSLKKGYSMKSAKTSVHSAAAGAYSMPFRQSHFRKGKHNSCYDWLFNPDREDREVIFDLMLKTRQRSHVDDGLFFGHLDICSDGGFKKDGNEELFYNQPRLYMTLAYLSIIPFNLYMICNFIQQVATRGPADSDMFMPLHNKGDGGAQDRMFFASLIVAGFEVFMIWLMLSYSGWIIFKYSLTKQKDKNNNYQMWHQLYTACCEILPICTNFSALMALQVLHPQIILTRVSMHLTKLEKEKHGRRRKRDVAFVYISFALKTMICGGFGFCAFVVKFTELYQRCYDTGRGVWSWQVNLMFQAVLFVSFINQTFGIVQIWKVESDRLFLFLFGGEDSQMQAGEVDRQEVFLATVVWNICTKFFREDPPKTRMLKRAIAILGFSHYDIQSLVLDEDESKEMDADAIRMKCVLNQGKKRNLGKRGALLVDGESAEVQDLSTTLQEQIEERNKQKNAGSLTPTSWTSSINSLTRTMTTLTKKPGHLNRADSI